MTLTMANSTTFCVLMPLVAIASYAGSQQAAVLGLKDLLETANEFRTSAVADTGEIELSILSDFTTRTATTFEAVILPSCPDGLPDREEVTQRSMKWPLNSFEAAVCDGLE